MRLSYLMNFFGGLTGEQKEYLSYITTLFHHLTSCEVEKGPHTQPLH